MISLILPPKDQISRAAKMLSDEFGTASNIKSRVNRLSVLSAITSTQQRLKLFSKARARPPRPLHPSRAASSPLPRALGGCQRAPSSAGHGPAADLLPMRAFLFRLAQVPPNGLVIYCGTILTDDNKEKKVNIDFEPFKPINTSLYLCDNKFHTEVRMRMRGVHAV